MEHNPPKEHSYHGSNWPEHEDFLVGNKEGLEKLQKAISEAIETGESNIDSGEFVGVRCLDTTFFEKKQIEKTRFSNIFGWLAAFIVAVVFIAGIKAIFSWISRLF